MVKFVLFVWFLILYFFCDNSYLTKFFPKISNLKLSHHPSNKSREKGLFPRFGGSILSFFNPNTVHLRLVSTGSTSGH